MRPVPPLSWHRRIPRRTTGTCFSPLTSCVTSVLPATPKTVLVGWKVTGVADRVEHSLTSPLRLVVVDYELPDRWFFTLHCQGSVAGRYLISESQAERGGCIACDWGASRL